MINIEVKKLKINKPNHEGSDAIFKAIKKLKPGQSFIVSDSSFAVNVAYYASKLLDAKFRSASEDGKRRIYRES